MKNKNALMKDTTPFFCINGLGGNDIYDLQQVIAKIAREQLYVTNDALRKVVAW
ncbi:hypothetical protein [Methylomonas sp. MK1]|uniref:hypothetical protein n=1 Tax=Methylomonas sp. MK1 TaxID=1131552 RepID=UPI00038245A7|nr:hypothetical protein [Methylomonas sp. MK1]